MDTYYELLDSGNGLKYERFADRTLIRPASQAVWKPRHSKKFWDQADGIFTREEGNCWTKELKGPWKIELSNIKFHLNPTDFGHLGIFPEQQPFWDWIQENTTPKMKVLNLFAYSGGSTLAAAKTGAQVVHVDASKGIVPLARENAILNGLEKAPIRWIVDDAMKFLNREIRRQNTYDAIIFDPPTFGRGTKGEVFKIEAHVTELISLCFKLLNENPAYLLFSCHTPGYTPVIMKNLLSQVVPTSEIDFGEMQLLGKDALPLPSGTFARWSRNGNQ